MCCRGQISCFLLLYFIVYTTSSPLSCGNLSLETMKKVASCPSTKEEKIKLAEQKNCERYWNVFKHNCNEDSSAFQYHCVINDHGNETIEVCGIKIQINGYCTEFNILGGKINEHYGYDCTKFNPPCEKKYNSADAYLYKPCYNFSSEQDKGSHLAFTSWTTSTETFKVKEKSSMVSDRTLHFRKSTTRNITVIHTSEYEHITRTSVYIERSTSALNLENESETFLLKYHIYIIFGLAGLLVLFVGIYVFSNICKKISNTKRYGRHDIQISSKEVDLIEHDNQRTSENIPRPENPQTYLSPVTVESNYEDIHFYHSPIETVMLEDFELPYTISDDKRGTYSDPSTYLTPKNNTYLTPVVDPKHAYVEVTE